MANVAKPPRTLFLGEPWVFSFNVRDPYGNAAQLAPDASIEWALFRYRTELARITTGAGITVLDDGTSATRGTARAKVSVADQAAAGYPIGQMNYEIWANVPGESDPVFVEQGPLYIQAPLRPIEPLDGPPGFFRFSGSRNSRNIAFL